MKKRTKGEVTIIYFHKHCSDLGDADEHGSVCVESPKLLKQLSKQCVRIKKKQQNVTTVTSLIAIEFYVHYFFVVRLYDKKKKGKAFIAICNFL